MDKTRVLFLCTGNSARSQMAEAFLRQLAGDRFEVFSAGLEPKGIHPYTRQVLAEAGLDISGQTSKDVAQFLGRVHFGYLITVCSNAEARCPIFPGVSVRLHWPFDDPAAAEGSEAERLACFRRVRDEIKAVIVAWLATNP
jgi:arsenate reductase